MALMAPPSGKLDRLVKLIPFRVPVRGRGEAAIRMMSSVDLLPVISTVKLLPVIKPWVVPTSRPVPDWPTM